jgi:hypothetical protein
VGKDRVAVNWEYLVTMAFSVLFMFIKNPTNAAKFKEAFLKLGRVIDQTFPGEICKPKP